MADDWVVVTAKDARGEVVSDAGGGVIREISPKTTEF